MRLRKCLSSRGRQRAFRSALVGESGQRRLSIEPLERRDLLARIVAVGSPLLEMDVQHASRLEVSSERSLPHYLRTCDGTLTLPHDDQQTSYSLSVTSFPGSDFAGSEGARFSWFSGDMNDPSNWAKSSVTGADVSLHNRSGRLDGAMVFSVFAPDMTDDIRSDGEKICQRSESASVSGASVAKFEIVADAGEEPGDLVILEADATASVSGDLGEASHVMTIRSGNAVLAEDVSTFRGVAQIGSTIELRGAMSGVFLWDSLSPGSQLFVGVYSYASAELPSPPAISVDNLKDPDTSKTIGPYLPGVEFDEWFTLTFDESIASFVEDVAVEFVEGGSVPVPQVTRVPGATDRWTFPMDMGHFTDDAILNISVSFTTLCKC